jgi:hypothetical protein
VKPSSYGSTQGIGLSCRYQLLAAPALLVFEVSMKDYATLLQAACATQLQRYTCFIDVQGWLAGFHGDAAAPRSTKFTRRP